MDKCTITRICPAKVNLFLHITGKRRNGYHTIESLIVPVPIYDELEVSMERGGEGVEMNTSGEPIADYNENIVITAAKMFLEETRLNCGIRINLKKNIPVGSGLGGGSSNGSNLLIAINEMSGMILSGERLHKMASRLGSDCPFFLYSKPALIKGIGDRVIFLDNFPRLPLLIVFPGFSVATKWAYQAFDRSNLTGKPKDDTYANSFVKDCSLKEMLSSPSLFSNDLEPVLIEQYPAIAEWKRRIIEAGALRAHVSGSGSSVFGIFKSEEAAQKALIKLKKQGMNREKFFACLSLS